MSGEMSGASAMFGKVAVYMLALGPCRGQAAAAPQNKARLTIPERLFAGGTARATSQLVLYPADALRTLAQTRAGSRSLRQLGSKTLVSGALTTSAFAYLIGGLQFAAFGAAAPALGPLGASACGACASCVISVPQEVIKQRLVTGIYPNFRVAVSTIWSSRGLRGFYTGWLPTTFRNVPFVVATFTTFAALEQQRLTARDQPALGMVESLQFGVASAVAAAFFTQPVDVVKTRMMTQAASTAVPYKNVGDCIVCSQPTSLPEYRTCLLPTPHWLLS